jgi:predicted HTH transcriptional regulator
MDDDLLENLLYQQESATLDFKERQYSFSNGTPEQKAELLKDILAFANAWRQTDAHILIGVKEVASGRAVICGIPPGHHLPEHSIQQLVSSKVNRAISFSYSTFIADGLELGILAIPNRR